MPCSVRLSIAALHRPPPSIVHAHAGWDFDIQDSNNIWVGALSGLVWLNNANGVWSQTTYNTITGINFVGVSRDASIVYVVTGLNKISPLGQTLAANLAAGPTNLYSFNPATGTYFNSGNPILSPATGYQFRGVSMAPVQVTPTPSVTASPTGSTSISSSVSQSPSPSNTASATPSPSNGWFNVTPSNTPSPSASVSLTGSATPSFTPTTSATASITPSFTPRGATFPGFQFLVVRMGNGSAPLPNPTYAQQVTVPVFVDVFADCTATTCSDGGATLIKTYSLASSWSGDVWGDRFISLNSQETYTFHQGRLSVSLDHSTVTLTGYDVWAGWNFIGASYKREPSLWQLFSNGSFTLAPICRVTNSYGSIVAQTFNAPYYCNGFDEDEIPYSIQATNDVARDYVFAGGDSNTAIVNQCWGACYGIRTFTGGFMTVTNPPALITNANDYLKVVRFANALFMIEGGTALNPHLGQSALLIMPWTTTAQFDGPAPVVLGNAADWLDFDVQDMSNGECIYLVFMVALGVLQ